jgi:ABC-2 type transport system permease protein
VTAGSVPWLLAHELRLAWRGSGKGNRKLTIIMLGVVFLTLAAGIGGPLATWVLPTWTPRVTPTLALGLDTALLLILSLMLSQTMSQAVEVFYARRDLDLLLSSPLPAWRVLAVRCIALAVTTSGTYLALVTPVVLTVALFGFVRWIAVYPLGLLIATALFRLIGPERTRTTAQLLAAFVGAAFFLVAQGFNFARDELGDDYARIINGWLASGWFDAGAPLAWPARAALGEAGPALGLLAGAAGLFAVAIAVFGRRVAENAAAAAGRERTGVLRGASAAGLRAPSSARS